VFGAELVFGPDGRFQRSVVADPEEGVGHDAPDRSVAGGLGEGDGGQPEEQRERHHSKYIGLFKTFLYRNVFLNKDIVAVGFSV
jgi:hypothetical protein